MTPSRSSCSFCPPVSEPAPSACAAKASRDVLTSTDVRAGTTPTSCGRGASWNWPSLERPDGATPCLGARRPDGATPCLGARRPDGAAPCLGARRPDGATPCLGARRPAGRQHLATVNVRVAFIRKSCVPLVISSVFQITPCAKPKERWEVLACLVAHAAGDDGGVGIRR